MALNLITAVSLNGVIGNQGKLPWKRIDIDMEHFFNTTVNHTVIMGSSTFLYDLKGISLYERQNIVLTRTKYKESELSHYLNIEVANSVQEALQLAANKEVFIIGGAKVYKAFLPLVEVLYYTHVLDNYEGDTYFPPIHWGEWELESEINSSTLCHINKYVRRF